MRRSAKDRHDKMKRREWADGRWPHGWKYYISTAGVSSFKRACRKAARAKAADDLRHGRESAPAYSVQTIYYD